MYNLKLPLTLTLILGSGLFTSLFAQPTWTLDPFGKEKKPEQYEEKKLGSEKTAEKKWTTSRRFIQNNVTHYNFYFNANNKLNSVIERAKISQKDDYSKILDFYPYNLENTSAQKTELDSVIYKATAGILLHDLRSDWVDNMYLLIGKSYLLRKEFDSAALTFQFINYNLFPRKKKEDDDRIVGTNDEPGSGLSIANKEKRNILQKALTLPPSRNDALIWLARTFIEKEEFGEASGLINILQNDRNLPARLRNDLEEVTAYWFYKQNNFDSSAVHLEKALSNADTKQDKSRWEYLLAQMFEMTGSFDKASDYYARASKHTVDPIMDIYAQLNDAKMMRNTGNYKELENSISNLLKMAKKDKYEAYRDVIYYSAGQLSMQKPDSVNAISQYLRSTKFNESNNIFRNRAYLQLGNIAYSQRRYKDAHSYYDSLDLTDPELATEAASLTDRKATLLKLVQHSDAIAREDSLQRIAALAPADRDEYVRKLVRKSRKDAGLKEDDNFAGNTLITFNNRNNDPIDLFAGNSKGDWYFYSNNLKSRGFTEFKNKWGKRNNVDNWRRKSATEANANNSSTASATGNPDDPMKQAVNSTAKPQQVEFTYEAFLENLPLTPEKIDSSNAVISENLLELARIFQNELMDYEQAIAFYNLFLQRFPSSKEEAEVYMGLYFSYMKLGDQGKAAYYKNILTTKYAGTSYSNMVVNPAAMDPGKQSPEVTSRYTDIYNMFIEGKFEEALQAKKIADSIYSDNYWTPQLLYIESVYHIRQRNDSAAIEVLKKLQTMYPESPLKAKAATMIEVLGRRASIESYLTTLEVTRQVEDTVLIADDKPMVVTQQVTQIPTTVKPITTPAVKAPQISRDSIKVPEVFVAGGFRHEPEKAHFVVMILDKVDGVYVNEAKNAFSRFNRESYYTQNLVINRDALDAEKTLLLFSPFPDATAALAYYEKIKKAAPREVSWLKADKYSFLIITESNLQVLKSNKDINAYRQLLNNNFGNKF